MFEDVFDAATVTEVNKEGAIGKLKINMFSAENDCRNWLLN